MLENRCYGPYSILADIGMSMFKARSSGGEKRFNKFRFSELAQKSKSIAADELIRMLQVVSYAIAAVCLIHA